MGGNNANHRASRVLELEEIEMEKLTVSYRKESGEKDSYELKSPSELIANFAKHILLGEACTIRNEAGTPIGGNAGKSGGVQGWYIKHPDIDNNEIKSIIIRNLEARWNYKFNE